MPIYVYRSTGDTHCPKCREGFELLQSVSEVPLTECPRCFAPIARVIGVTNIASRSPDISDRNLDRTGFTRYRRSEKGVYEKTAGPGPDIVKKTD